MYNLKETSAFSAIEIDNYRRGTEIGFQYTQEFSRILSDNLPIEEITRFPYHNLGEALQEASGKEIKTLPELSSRIESLALQLESMESSEFLIDVLTRFSKKQTL